MHKFYRKYRKKKGGGGQQGSVSGKELRSAMQIAAQQTKSVKRSTTKKETQQGSVEKATKVLDLMCTVHEKVNAFTYSMNIYIYIYNSTKKAQLMTTN